MTYSQAIAEAWSSSDVAETTLALVELRHPAFIDDNGNPTAIRVVQAFEDYEIKLEDDAPMNPGEWVTFQSCPFDFVMPSVGKDEVPSFQFKLDNVSREVTKYLEMAIVQLTPIEMTFRVYLASMPDTPQLVPPYAFTLTRVVADAFQITGTATLGDVYNVPFPGRKYTPKDFTTLVRS